MAAGPSNYFGKIDPNLIRNVEKNHLRPALSRLESGDLYDQSGRRRDKHFEWAKGDLDFVLRYIPNHPKALEAMGELCLQWGKSEIGIDYYMKAIDAFPRVSYSYEGFGLYLLKLGQIRDAVKAFELGVKLEPNAPAGHYNLALAYYKNGNIEQAEEHAKRAKDLGSDVSKLEALLNKEQAPGARDQDK